MKKSSFIVCAVFNVKFDNLWDSWVNNPMNSAEEYIPLEPIPKKDYSYSVEPMLKVGRTEYINRLNRLR